jgi:hypothetical protein
MMKFLTMGLAVSVMGLNMARVGVPTSPVELVIFPTITLVNTVMAVVLLKSVDANASTQLAHENPLSKG